MSGYVKYDGPMKKRSRMLANGFGFEIEDPNTKLTNVQAKSIFLCKHSKLFSDLKAERSLDSSPRVLTPVSVDFNNICTLLAL